MCDNFQDNVGGGGDGGGGGSDGVLPSLVTWLGGIALLTFALFLSARMGIYQECLYARYGKHPWEALFYIVSLKTMYPIPLLLQVDYQ